MGAMRVWIRYSYRRPRKLPWLAYSPDHPGVQVYGSSPKNAEARFCALMEARKHV